MRKNSFSLYTFQLFFILLYFIQTACAQQPDQTIQAQNSIWATGNYFVIETKDQASNIQKMIVTIYDYENLNIELSGKETGTLKLLNGRTLITQGINSTDQFMIDRLDLASLMTQLTINLLEVTVPEGPQLKITKQIDLQEKNKNLAAGSMSACINIPPPWDLTGTVAPTKNGIINFDFKLTAHNQKTQIKGSWEKQHPVPQMDDNMSLTDWKIYKLGARTFKDGKSTIMDYGTTEISSTAKTLGELRKSLLTKK